MYKNLNHPQKLHPSKFVCIQYACAKVLNEEHQLFSILVSTLNSLHNYSCGAMATNVLPRKKHFI